MRKGKQPFWESAPFWGLVGLLGTIILNTIFARVKNLSGLLIIGWACGIPISLFICRRISRNWIRYSVNILFLSVLATGLYCLNKIRPHPEPASATPGIILKNDSNGNDVSGNQFIAQPDAQITVNHSSDNAVHGNVWMPALPSVEEEPNKFDAMTGVQLVLAVSKIVKKLRAFDKRMVAQNESIEDPDPKRMEAWLKADKAQREQMQRDWRHRLSEMGNPNDIYFQDNFLNDCRAANAVLNKRVSARPSKSIRFAMVGTTLRSGMLGGPYPMRNLADYLEQRATQLRAQSKNR